MRSKFFAIVCSIALCCCVLVLPNAEKASAVETSESVLTFSQVADMGIDLNGARVGLHAEYDTDFSGADIFVRLIVNDGDNAYGYIQFAVGGGMSITIYADGEYKYNYSGAEQLADGEYYYILDFPNPNPVYSIRLDTVYSYSSSFATVYPISEFAMPSPIGGRASLYDCWFRYFDISLQSYINAYNDGLAQSKDYWYEVGLNEGLATSSQQSYQNGYNDGKRDGYTEGSLSTTDLPDLFNAVVTAPIHGFLTVLDFDILGTNIKGMFIGLFASIIVLFILKMAVIK